MADSLLHTYFTISRPQFHLKSAIFSHGLLRENQRAVLLAVQLTRA